MSFTTLCISFIILPIPIGMFWIWVYKNRRTLGLPDWLSGILAQGIISGHKVNKGKAEDTDYSFIIIATIVSVLVIVFGCNFLLSLGGGYSSPPDSAPYQQPYSSPTPEPTRRPTSTSKPPASNNSSQLSSSSSSQVTEYAKISCADELNFVNLRRTPGYTNKNDTVDSIYEVPCGEYMELLGDTEYVDGLTWWKVSWSGYTGWMADHTGSGRTILIFDP